MLYNQSVLDILHKFETDECNRWQSMLIKAIYGIVLMIAALLNQPYYRLRDVNG